jgi:ADP-ribose pyrophosphatase YjhB (NUDIX family)
MSELAERRPPRGFLEADETALAEAKRALQETQASRASWRPAARTEGAPRRARARIDQISATLARLGGERQESERERATLESRRAENAKRLEELAGALARVSTPEPHPRGDRRRRAALPDLQARKDEIARQVMQVSLELENLEETVRRAREEGAGTGPRATTSLAVGQKRQENQSIESQDGQLSLALADLEQRIAGLSAASRSPTRR